MFKTIQRFCTAPTFDDNDERTRLGRYVYLLSYISLAVIALISMALPMLAGRVSQLTLVVMMAAPFVLVQMLLVRKGFIRLAATVQVSMGWLLINYTALSTGGVQAVGFAGNLVVILAAGMLISLEAALVFGSLSVVLGLGLALAQTHGLLPPVPPAVTAYTAWLTQTAFLMLNSGMLYITVHNIQLALARTRRAEARLRALVENSPDFILEVSPEGRLTFINRYSDFYLGKHVTELVAPEFVGAVRQALTQVFETGQPASLEVQTFSRAGPRSGAPSASGPLLTITGYLA